MTDGTLFYVVGPSGSGKDSLLRYARAHLSGNSVSGNPGVVFAHRYITRPVEIDGENHIALTRDEFDARLGAGLFTMHWESHGLRYGIGREIHLWLARGCHVVLNGSRAYLQQARDRYPEMVAVWVEVSADVLEARLRARGRENAAQIAARVARAAQFRPDGDDAHVVRNDGALEQGGNHLLALIDARRGATSCA